MSLKNQLLKAGLASSKQARRAEHEKRQARHRAKKGKELSTAEVARQRQAEQAERSRLLNEQREAEQRERALRAEIQQLIETHQVARQGGEQSYQFVHGKQIAKIYVLENMIRPLSSGQMGIVFWADRYEVLPREALERLAERDETVIVSWHKETEQTPAEDDPYADFPIPDDLMW
ncbi:MAG TPA: DUF2058 domain-containing protein [Alcanivoracaceae bacterium]|nr:DUF2058 domain-containing protein [Alcanivoracaceae bacterium]